MTQSERRRFLIEYLINESPRYKDVEIPEDEAGQKYLLRSLMNVREPLPASDEFLQIQDEYLQETNHSHGI
ncbi:MAG: protein-ADP-ribose hydrolase, partial [Spirochaetaceae bacterium]|nr:protein-ADP-ribose hydrolase [Spirochaetaceae bacterium]